MDLPAIDFASWFPKIFEVVRWFLQTFNPFVMMVVAIFVVIAIISVIAYLLGGGEDSDDDKGYDVDHY